MAACSPPIESVPTDSLIGSWELQEWKGIRPDGSILYPYGTDARGLLIYTQEGSMSMALSKSDRPELGTDDYSLVADSVIRLAYTHFFSYSGGFQVDSNQVTHLIEHCKQPDWVGRELVRAFDISGDTLTIRSPEVIGADHILTWLRKD